MVGLKKGYRNSCVGKRKKLMNFSLVNINMILLSISSGVCREKENKGGKGKLKKRSIHCNCQY